MSTSPEAEFLSNKKKIEDWAKDSIDWLKKEFGKENIIKSQLHLDETTPHLHTFIVPIKDKKLNCKYFLGTREKLSKLQTNYHKKIEKYGVQRGLEGSKATHLDIKKFYALLNEALEKELPDTKFLESSKSYKERIQEEYTKLCVKNLDLELKIENLKNQILKRPSILEQLRESEEFTNIKEFLKMHPEVKRSTKQSYQTRTTKTKKEKKYK
jgi:hypothetical protein